jgi:hypothetical protein
MVFFLPIPMNAVENHLKESISKEYSDRVIIHGRVVNLTAKKKGRGPCMYRNLCSRGCPFLVILAVIPQHYLTLKRPEFNSNQIQL